MGELEGNAKRAFEAYLADPQALNSYGYARNNPTRFLDPDGELFKEWLAVAQGDPTARLALGMRVEQLANQSSLFNAALEHPYTAGAVIGVAGGAVAVAGSAAATAISVNMFGGAGTACVAFCGQLGQSGQKIIDYTSQFGMNLGAKMNQVAQNLRGTQYKFSDHSIMRIAQKLGVGNEGRITNMLANIKPFEYFHEGIQKLGYYDPLSQIFIGQIKDTQLITTVITTVSKNYINNLLK